MKEEIKPIDTAEENPYTNRQTAFSLDSKESLHISLTTLEINLSSCTLSLDELIQRAVFLKEHFFNGTNKKFMGGVG
jgi:hypothetical protein